METINECPQCHGGVLSRVIRPSQVDVWCVGHRDDGRDRCGWRTSVNPKKHETTCAECSHVLRMHLNVPAPTTGPYR